MRKMYVLLAYTGQLCNDMNCLSLWRTLAYHGVFNTLRPRQDGRHFPDDIFKCIFFNENIWIPIQISMKFVPKGPINNIPALVRIMAWRRPGDKPLSEPMMARVPTRICVTRPQWVKLAFQWIMDTGFHISLCTVINETYARVSCFTYG